MHEFITFIEERLEKYSNLSNECKIQYIASELVEKYPTTPVVLAAMAVMYVQIQDKNPTPKDISCITDCFTRISD